MGIKSDASQEDIKKAYRKAAFSCHPDRFGDDERSLCEDIFKRVLEAVKVLLDPEKRREYDEMCHGEDLTLEDDIDEDFNWEQNESTMGASTSQGLQSAPLYWQEIRTNGSLGNVSHMTIGPDGRIFLPRKLESNAVVVGTDNAVTILVDARGKQIKMHDGEEICISGQLIGFVAGGTERNSFDMKLYNLASMDRMANVSDGRTGFEHAVICFNGDIFASNAGNVYLYEKDSYKTYSWRPRHLENDYITALCVDDRKRVLMVAYKGSILLVDITKFSQPYNPVIGSIAIRGFNISAMTIDDSGNIYIAGTDLIGDTHVKKISMNPKTGKLYPVWENTIEDMSKVFGIGFRYGKLVICGEVDGTPKIMEGIMKNLLGPVHVKVKAIATEDVLRVEDRLRDRSLVAFGDFSSFAGFMRGFFKGRRDVSFVDVGCGSIAQFGTKLFDIAGNMGINFSQDSISFDSAYLERDVTNGIRSHRVAVADITDSRDRDYYCLNDESRDIVFINNIVNTNVIPDSAGLLKENGVLMITFSKTDVEGDSPNIVRNSKNILRGLSQRDAEYDYIILGEDGEMVMPSDYPQSNDQYASYRTMLVVLKVRKGTATPQRLVGESV